HRTEAGSAATANRLDGRDRLAGCAHGQSSPRTTGAGVPPKPETTGAHAFGTTRPGLGSWALTFGLVQEGDHQEHCRSGTKSRVGLTVAVRKWRAAEIRHDIRHDMTGSLRTRSSAPAPESRAQIPARSLPQLRAPAAHHHP